MQLEKYKQLATAIADLIGEGYTAPNGRMEEYSLPETDAGLTFALALFYVAAYPLELESVLKQHQINLQLFVEELESRRHRDDTLDLSAFKL